MTMAMAMDGPCFCCRRGRLAPGPSPGDVCLAPIVPAGFPRPMPLGWPSVPRRPWRAAPPETEDPVGLPAGRDEADRDGLSRGAEAGPPSLERLRATHPARAARAVRGDEHFGWRRVPGGGGRGGGAMDDDRASFCVPAHEVGPVVGGG